MRPLPRLLTCALLALTLAACGSDDTATTVDASTQVDAPPTACNLPGTVTTCTDENNDAPCQTAAGCAQAECRRFTMNPSGLFCTYPCPNGNSDCPSGWTCNTMGTACRPPPQ